MRLKITQQPANVHSEIVPALGWTASNELFTIGDDKKVQRWNVDGEPLALVSTLDTFVTDMHWFPFKKGSGVEVFTVSCSDGSFRLYSKTGKLEKQVDKAHSGAVTSVRWSFEGSSLLTSGEDGVLKVWSRNGMLRSTLISLGVCIYSVAWGPNNDVILFSVGKDLVLKPLQPSSKQLQWKAHDGTVLRVDWNPVNNLIVSGGEDCKYKVWDSYGRLLFQSKPSENIITSVSWAPDGEMFAVGSYNSLVLCDKTGWSYCAREKPPQECGSLFNIGWTLDGTLVAAGGGNGAVIFGQIIEKKLEWQNVIVTLTEPNRIHVQNVTTDQIDELPFRDRVVKMSLGFGFLIVATSTQIHIYNILAGSGTPIVFDLKDAVNLIIQCDRHFLTVDNFSGIQIYSYEGRVLGNPKFGGLRTEFLSHQTITLSKDFLAILDRSDRKVIHFVDIASGKPLENTVAHSLEIIEIYINQYGLPGQRKIAFIDKNHDLYISFVQKPRVVKVASMVNSARWNDKTDMLAGVVDGNFIVWLYPNAHFFDKDLANVAKSQREASVEFGKNPHIVTFYGKTCTVRRTDGALITTSVTAYPLMLYEFCEKADWEKAVRLCRFVKDPTLWAMLAALAIDGNELNTAEEGYAAIEQIDKMQFIAHIKNIPIREARNAELLLFKGQTKEAETLLLQANQVYRAIKLNLRFFRWERALEIALKKKVHIDTVIATRAKYLESVGKEETLKVFKDNQCEYNWATIKQRIQQEKESQAYT